jgi:DNA-binding CsgD family transcriptional regulator
MGQLLGVAERTAVFHIQNAARKLDVNGRQAAVARAVSLGLINPA